MSERKAIIAGGREYRFTEGDRAWLDSLNLKLVITGGARGADTEAENWATERGIPVRVFPADWDKYGKRAGPTRNQQMAEYLLSLPPSRRVILFPGGRGTANMKKQAEKLGLKVIERKLV